MGVDHLVVVVHQLVGAQQAAVLLVDGRKLHPFHFYLFQILAGDHAVFHIGNGGLYRLDGALRGKFHALPPADLSDDGRLASDILQQLEGLAALGTLIGPNDSAAHSVDGAKLQPLCIRFSEHPRKPPAHIIRCRHRIGHYQDRLRCYSQAIDHIAQSADQYGGLTASWNRKKQYRTFRSLYRLHLLFV